MKIVKQGFRIEDISARVAGVDSDGEYARIAFVANAEGDETLSPELDTDELGALIEALTEARKLLGGGVPNAGRKLAYLKDHSGDLWYPIENGKFAMLDSSMRTRESVEGTYGPVQEVWE